MAALQKLWNFFINYFILFIFFNQSKDSSRAALNPENRFQNGPIITQVKGPKFKPKQRRVVFPPAL